jgi:O-antigen ligase/Flp pilus assembly protein TadD
VRQSLDQALCALFLLSIGLAFSTNFDVQFTLPKLFWFRAIGAALVAAWLVRFYRGDVKPVPRSVLVAACALLSWWVLTTTTAVDLFTALHGAHGRYNGLINEATLIIVFLIAASLPASTQDLDFRVALIVASAVPLAVFAVAQYLGLDPRVWPNPRPAATIGHPVPLAAILSLVAPFVVAFTLTETNRWRRRIGVAVFALLAAAVGATLSRGPWAGFAIGVIAVLIAARWVGALRVSGKAIAVIAILIALTGRSAWNSGQMVLLRDRLSSLTTISQGPSFMNRFVYLNAAGRMVRDHPVVGIGFENFGVLYPRYRPVEGEVVPIDQVPTMVHNGYVERAVTHGPIGLGLYLLLVGAIVVRLWQTVRGLHAGMPAGATRRDVLVGAAFIGAIAGFMTQDLTGWEELSLSTFFWIVLGTALSFSTSRGPALTWRPPAVWKGPIVATGFAAAVALAALSWTTLVAMRSGQFLFEASALDISRDWSRIDANLNYALQLSGGSAHYADAAGVLYVRRFFTAGERPVYDRAVQLLDSAAQADPFDPYVLIHRVDLETIALQMKTVAAPSSGATAAVDRLIEMDPNNATAHMAVARLRLAEGKFGDSLASIRTAQRLRPTQPRYHLIEGDIHRSLGDRVRQVAAYKAETRLLAPNQPGWDEAERKLILALIESDRHQEAADEALAAVDRRPNDVVLRTLLGIAYLGLSSPDLATASFEKALSIDPANTSARQGLVEAGQLRATKSARNP